MSAAFLDDDLTVLESQTAAERGERRACGNPACNQWESYGENDDVHGPDGLCADCFVGAAYLDLLDACGDAVQRDDEAGRRLDEMLSVIEEQHDDMVEATRKRWRRLARARKAARNIGGAA